jgi:hypothetical protein
LSESEEEKDRPTNAIFFTAFFFFYNHKEGSICDAKKKEWVTLSVFFRRSLFSFSFSVYHLFWQAM